MAFIQKKDYFSMDGSAIKIAASNDNATATETNAENEQGDVVATTVHSQIKAPSCDFELLTDWENEEGDDQLYLGKVSTLDGESFALATITINTAKRALPKVSASGSQVEDSAQEASIYKIPAFSLLRRNRAQILFGAFTLGGAGCHLQSANYVISVQLVNSNVDGTFLAFDVCGGKIEATVTIGQSGSAVPTITPATGWTVTSPLACANPNADYPTWTAKLTLNLAAETEDAQA